MHTTQRLDHTTLNRVRKYGKMGESFDKALSRVLDKVEQGEEVPV
jgi:hypothetical protein